jgi:hypothetical protein
MSSSSDFELIHGQLHVTKDPSKPEILGRGPLSIHGATYQQGPNLQGSDKAFPNIWATTMVGPLDNSDSPPPIIPGALVACGLWNHSPYSLAVTGDAAIFNNLDVNVDINAGAVVRAGALVQSQGDVVAFCGVHRLSAKKNFDIPHPTKEGWRLTHTCVEGPEASVYIRGRVRNKTEILLPEYWKGLVDINTITVNLTPIGSHQDVIIRRWDDEKVYLQSKGGMSIDCFYYIMAERKDTEKLIPEYEGSIEDYPGDNSQRSIAGYHYDTKE